MTPLLWVLLGMLAGGGIAITGVVCGEALRRDSKARFREPRDLRQHRRADG